jgi:hypothetical protein
MKISKTLILVFSILAIISIFLIVFFNNNDGHKDNDSAVPLAYKEYVDNLMAGGPGKDGIPAIENPKYHDVESANLFLDPKDAVFLVKIANEVKIYPQKILVWHEIVNENFNGEILSITYCPLTASAIGYKGYIEKIKKVTSYGVSGKLLNSNLVMYDRATDSYIPQVLGKAIKGELTGEIIDTFPVVWTTWQLAKERYPRAQVLTSDTGYLRNYNDDPYGSYKEKGNYYDSGKTLFPLLNTDNRLQEKEIVTGIRLHDNPLAIHKDFMRKNKIYNDQSAEIVAFYDETLDTARVFSSKFKGEVLTFSFEDGVFSDHNGLVWSSEGISSEGTLEWVDSFDVMWFSWASYFPETRLVE